MSDTTTTEMIDGAVYGWTRKGARGWEISVDAMRWQPPDPQKGPRLWTVECLTCGEPIAAFDLTTPALVHLYHAAVQTLCERHSAQFPDHLIHGSLVEA